MIAVGDWDGDGDPDFMARASNGWLHLYRNAGAGTFEPGTARAGTGWNAMTMMFSPGDWDGDGDPDLIARAPDNTLRHYAGNQAVTATWPSTVQQRNTYDFIETPPAYTATTYTYTLKNGNRTFASDMVRTSQTESIEVPNANRTSRVDHNYNEWGTPSSTQNRGDTATSTDNTCTSYNTSHNTTTNVTVVWRTTTRAGDSCSSGTMLGQSHTWYDGNGATSTPATAGNPTRTRIHRDATTVQDQRFVYDGYGRVTSTDNPYSGSSTTTTTYSPAIGIATTVKTNHPIGSDTVVGLSALQGTITWSDDVGSNRTHLTHDGLDRLTEVHLPQQPTSGPGNLEYTYNITANEIEVTATEFVAVNGSTDVFVDTVDYYDSFGRPRETQTASPTSGLRIVTATEYNAAGAIDWTSNPYTDSGSAGGGLDNRTPSQIWLTTQPAYDSLSRPLYTRTLDNNTELWRTYTGHDLDKITTIDPAGDVSYQQHNARGELAVTFDSIDATTYTYTRLGQLDTVTTPDGAVTNIDYDWAGDKTRLDDPDAGVWNYTYDARGRLAHEYTNLRSLLTLYDALDRPTHRCTPTSITSSTCATTHATWTYHQASSGIDEGRLHIATSHQDGNQYTQTSQWDHRGNLTSDAVTVPAAEGNLAGTYTTTHNYDAAGTHTTTTHPSVAGLPAETVTYSYTNLGLFQSLTGDYPYISNQTYDSLARPSITTLGTSGTNPYTNVANTYDPVTGRLQRINNTGGTVDLNYSYYPDGNIEKIYNAGLNQSEHYVYDTADRIVFARTRAGNTLTGPTDWSTNGFDMRWSYTNTGAIDQHIDYGLHINNYSYTSQRRAATQITDTTYNSGTETFTYDTEGNRKTWTTPTSTTTYHYTPTGQLQTIALNTGNGTTPANTTTHIYDTNGQRLLTRNGITNHHATLWIGPTQIERDATGTLTATRQHNTPTGHGALRQPTNWHTITVDHIHSTRATTNTTGTTTTHHYDPFGTPRTNTTTTPTNRLYTSQLADTNRLYYYNARYYDPHLSQFTQPDTIIPNPGSGQDFNRYTYVRNNPTNYNDPTGHCVGGMECRWAIQDEVRAVHTGCTPDAHSFNTGACRSSESDTALLAASGHRPASAGYYIAAAVLVAVGVGWIGRAAETGHDGYHCAAGFGFDFATAIDCGSAVVPFVHASSDEAVDAARAVDDAPSGLADDVVGAVRPNRIVGPGDVELPGVPSGVQGVPTTSGRGLTYDLPAGTSGIDSRVTQIRVMDPLTTRAHQYPNGYVVYMNQAGQTVNPLTGQTIANSDPFAHIPLPG